MMVTDDGFPDAMKAMFILTGCGGRGVRPGNELGPLAPVAMWVIGRRVCSNMGLALASDAAFGLAGLNDVNTNNSTATKASPLQTYPVAGRRCLFRGSHFMGWWF